MKMTIHSTDKIVYIVVGDQCAVPARVWQGTSERGVPVIVFVTRIAAERDADLAEFTAELQEHAPPTADVRQWPARLVLD